MTLCALPRAERVSSNDCRASKHRINRRSSLQGAFTCPNRSENTTFRKRTSSPEVLHRPVEPAPLIRHFRVSTKSGGVHLVQPVGVSALGAGRHSVRKAGPPYCSAASAMKGVVDCTSKIQNLR